VVTTFSAGIRFLCWIPLETGGMILVCIYRVPQKPRFSSSPSTPINRPTVLNHQSSTTFRIAKMSENHPLNIIDSNNTSPFSGMWSRCTSTVTDDRPQILAWLSPLEPRIRHKEIQESRVENVGGWVLETEEFRSWYAGSEGSGSDNAVLFCYGDPWVGKTFIR